LGQVATEIAMHVLREGGDLLEVFKAAPQAALAAMLQVITDCNLKDH
jgi:hypothetical protein